MIKILDTNYSKKQNIDLHSLSSKSTTSYCFGYFYNVQMTGRLEMHTKYIQKGKGSVQRRKNVWYGIIKIDLNII